jgi:hypothetical protein
LVTPSAVAGYVYVNLRVALALSIFVSAAVLALVLAVFCFLQLAVHKESTEQSLGTSKQFVERSRLGEKPTPRARYIPSKHTLE